MASSYGGEELISRDAPKILILYGSTRTKSYSKLLADEAARILEYFGAEVRVFDPTDLPLFNADIDPNSDTERYTRVIDLISLNSWSEAQVWISPEIHGQMRSVFKNQIDWIPLKTGSVRPTQGKILALCQLSGGSQSFNVVNSMRVLGRWMRMFTIPNQSSVPKIDQEFEDDGVMKDSSYRNRLIDVMEELFKFTLLLRGNLNYLVARFSEEPDCDVTDTRCKNKGSVL
jgi:arsenic resistance protein ArsH